MTRLAAILAAALSFLLGLHLGVQKCRPSVDRDGDAGFFEGGFGL